MRLSISFLSASLLVTSLQAEPVLSNSPHSPYRQLHTLMEEMEGLRKEMEGLNVDKNVVNNVLEAISQEAQHRNLMFENLQAENESLKDSLNKLTTDYESLKAKVAALEKQQDKTPDEVVNNAIKNVEALSEWKNKNEEVLQQLQLDLPGIKKVNYELKWIKENTENFIKVSYEEIHKKIKILESEINKIVASNSKIQANDLQSQVNNIKKEVTEKCKSICASTLSQANDRLQSLAQQMQANFDRIREKDYMKHIVLSGESLNSIAKRYQLSVQQILSANQIQNAKSIKVGDMLWIPKNI